MFLPIARALVTLRGLRNRLRGRGDDSGLTIPCRGCGDPSPHDAHLAAGAIDVLGSR